MPIIASLVGHIYNIQIHDVFSRLSFQHDHARSFGQSCYYLRMDNRTDRARLLIPSRGRPRFSIRYCDHFKPDRRDPNSSQDIGNECDLICSIVFFGSIRSQQDSGRMVWQIIKSRMHLPDGSWVRLQQNEAFVEAFRKIVKGSEVWQRRLAIEKLKNQYKWTVSELLRSAREEMTYRTQFFYRIALHGFACDSRKATNSRAVITVGWNALPVTWRRSRLRRRKKIV